MAITSVAELFGIAGYLQRIQRATAAMHYWLYKNSSNVSVEWLLVQLLTSSESLSVSDSPKTFGLT